MRQLITLLLLMLSSLQAFPQANIYVSPSSNGAGNGSRQRPYTIQQAIKNARKGTTINLAAGNYYLSAPLTFSSSANDLILKGSDDGNTRIIGGISAGKWSRYRGNIYRTKIKPGIDVTQLYVNGRFCSPAKYPDSGYIEVKAINGKSMTFNPKDLSVLSGLTTDEIQRLSFQFFQRWDVMDWIPGTVNVRRGTVNFKAGKMKSWNPIAKGTRCVIYNSPKALNQRGEWYFDKSESYLYYIPLADENMNNAEAIIPTTPQLLRIEGQQGKPVTSISFKNIDFECTSHAIPVDGDGPEQAASHVEGAIDLQFANNISFYNCSVSLTGGYAFNIGEQCQNDTIQHCLLSNLGAGGIKVGLSTYKKGDDVTEGIVVDNNIIRSLGFQMASGAGILVMNASNCKITHNDISDLYYSGISVGWTWGFNEAGRYNPSVNNAIAYNRIHNIGQGVLSDLAGIYTLGVSPGTTVNNNVVFDVKCADYGGFGLYADEGSSNITFTNNLVYNCSTGTFQENYGRDNIIKNNIFAYGGEYQLHLGKTSSGSSFSFTNNIVLYSTGRTLSGSLAWIEKGKFTMDYNIYWHQNGKLDLATMNLSNWKGYQDKHSIEADPGFVSSSTGDFHFNSLTAAKKIGFQPFDYTLAGVYGSNEWKDEAQHK